MLVLLLGCCSYIAPSSSPYVASCLLVCPSLSYDRIWMYHPREAAFSTRMGCSYHLMPMVHGHQLLLLPFWEVSWCYHSSASVSTDALERNQLKMIHNGFFNSSQFYLHQNSHFKVLFLVYMVSYISTYNI